MMRLPYRGMDRPTLDAALNNGQAVPDWPLMRDAWSRRSAGLRASHPGAVECRYGDRPRNRLDWFPGTGPDAPIMVFVHGGYWQWNDKETFGFVAEGALGHGLAVANVEYTLAPDARIGEIVAEIGAALDFIRDSMVPRDGKPQKLCLVGHSAGGHLVEHHRARPDVTACVTISGVFDLEPVSLSYLNAALQLTAREVETYSPVLHPVKGGDLIMTVGANELPELLRQTARYERAARAAGQRVRVIPALGRNHFDILEDLAGAEGPLLHAVLDAVS